VQFRDSLAEGDKCLKVAGAITAFPKDLMRDRRALGVNASGFKAKRLGVEAVAGCVA
jgi:hypothetical protein